jgi:hypothetical protein
LRSCCRQTVQKNLEETSMTPQERSWMAELLGVRPPWQVQAVRVAASERLVTVQIGPLPEAGPRFWPGRRAAPAGRRLHWNHLGLAGQRCEIALQLAEGQGVPDMPWAGDPALPFTHALSRLVLDLMLDGATMAQLCRLLDLPLSALWKYKFRLDQGSARAPLPRAALPAPEPAQPAPPVRTASGAAEAPTEAGTARTAEDLPAEDDPVWLNLLRGRLSLDVRALSLKLLLSKLGREAQSHQDADLHRQAAQSLHRYMQRNQAVLGHELAQLRAASATPAAGSPVPDVSDPLWQALLSGECELEVRTLSLRLLLSKLRQQARSLQDDELRMLKLVELHRYFEKHHAALPHEMAQLRRWTVH